MVRYFYSLAPIGIVVGTAALLSGPLALIALLAVSFVAVAALAWAILSVPLMLGRAISHRWQDRGGVSPRATAALSETSSGVRSTRPVPAGARVLFARPPSERDT